ncbi:MAG: DUF1080 domain-containing protein [Planctomycetes bacterium]|nr:DUF1080 domain-containing protein [Planctomycetota bacterium]
MFFALALGAVVQAPDYRVPTGFAVEPVGELARSFLALTIDRDGRLFLAVESGPIVWLADRDHDGAYESTGELASGVESAQGLCWRGDELWAVGRRDGADGVFAIETDPEHTTVRRVEQRFAILGANGDDPPGEHGAHGLVAGPDGALYLSVGNHARLATPPESASPLVAGYEGTLGEPFYDPNGHATHVRYPCGYVARLDPDGATWRYVAVGLRNAYDLAFDARGELFTFDSDMEWDVGLPWYRATRFLHVVDGADFGSRTGSYPWADWYDDALPPIVEAGRGSPTGVVVYEHDAWGPSWRGAVLGADWARGRIVALRVTRDGGGLRGELETLLEARQGFNVTDLDVGPDGALYFTSGGRGVIGRIERLVRRGDSVPADGGRARTVAAIHALDRAERATIAAAATPTAELVAALAHDDVDVRARGAYWLGRRLERTASAELLALAAKAARDRSPAVRAEALRAFGLARACDDSGRGAIVAALAEADRIVRHAARFAWDRAVGPSSSATPNVDPLLWVRRWVEEHPAPLDAAAQHEPRTLYLPQALPQSVDAWLVMARALQLGLAELGADTVLQGQGVDWDRALLNAFPHADFRVSRMLAELLAVRDRRGARERLLAELATESDRVQRLHYAFALSECGTAWTDAELRAYFGFLDEAEAWSEGGASYAGYLERLRERFDDRLGLERKHALATSAPLGVRTLARFVREAAAARPGDPEPITALVPALKYAWVAAERGRAELEVRNERAAALRGLGNARSAELASWLRKLADEALEPRDDVLRALALQAEPTDVAYFVAGLASDSAATVDACADALTQCAEAPRDADSVLAAIRAIRRLGPSRGARVTALAAAWLGVERREGAPTDPLAVLASIEREFRARFPDVPLEATGDERGPRLDVERLAAFLERSAARSGSSQRGKELFERASCASCHVVAGTTFGVASLGVGPELSDVGRRFDTRALLEAVLTPSRSIAELYRTTVVITSDERRLEGRVVREDANGLELLFADGTRGSLARDEIEELFPSTVSLMPEGLLSGFDAEDVKDLVAFLAAGKVLADDDARPLESLFAGKARNLWIGDRDVWVLDGELVVGTGRALERNAYLVSKRSWSDFEFACDVKLSAGANSGVQLRSRIAPEAVDPLGLQLDLGQSYWGSFYDTEGRGLVHAADPRWREVVDPLGWNHVFARCVGSRWTVELNGLVVADLVDASSASGVLAFQVHQGLDMEVRIANARLRELGER